MKWGRILVVFAAVTFLTGASCDRPARSGELIDSYRRAECVPANLR
jgi:hypothetical protein